MKRAALVIIMALSGGAVPATGQMPDANLSEIVLPPEIDTLLRAYEDAWERRNAQVLADLFTEDGFVLRPNSPPARGRAAIRAAYANSGGPLVLRAYSFAVSDSVGYIVGGFARADDDPDIGKFVLALKKGSGGRWLIAADIDNSNF